MSKALVAGLLGSFTNVIAQHMQQKQQDEKQDREDNLRMYSLVIQSPDATPEDKSAALDAYLDILGGKKVGASKGKTGGAGDPFDGFRNTMGRIFRGGPAPGSSEAAGAGGGITQTPDMSGPDGGGIVQKPNVRFDTTLADMPARKSAKGVTFKPAAEADTKLPDLPTRRAGGFQMNQREATAAREKADTIEAENRAQANRVALEELRYKHDIAVKSGNLKATGTKQAGRDIASDTDYLGDPIDRSENAQYKVFQRMDGTLTYMRDLDKTLSGVDKAINEKAQQIKAADQAAGRELKADSEYLMQARVEARRDTITARTEKLGRYEQFLKTSAGALQLSNARTNLDVERLKQLQQEFPVTFELKQLNVDTAKAKLDLLGQPSPSGLMEWATNQARILISTKGGNYEGEDLTTVRDALLKEMGQDPIDLAAQIKARQAVKERLGASSASPELKAAVKAYLASHDYKDDDANVNKFISNPNNAEFLKTLVPAKK